MVSENQQSRERFGGIASRTVSAVMTGDTNELNSIIRDVTDSQSSDESSGQPVEAGGPDRTVGSEGTAGTSG